MSPQPPRPSSPWQAVGLFGVVFAASLLAAVSPWPPGKPASAGPDQRAHAGPFPAGAVVLPASAPGVAAVDPFASADGPSQATVRLSEDFESAAWPSGSGWRVLDNNGSEGGEFTWANRCEGHHSARSAWAVGGGANGSLLACGANYPDHAASYMVYGPLDFSAVTQAELAWVFYLDSECVGTNCATASDTLRVLASTNGTNFDGIAYAGNWKDDPNAHPGGWVEDTWDMANYVGQPQVWLAFGFLSDGSVNYPIGAKVDDVVLRVTAACDTWASLRSVTPDRTCYIPGATAGVLVDVGTTGATRAVKLDVQLWSGDIIWASNSVTFDAPGQRVVSITIPADLWPGSYEIVAVVYDAADPDCMQARRAVPVQVDPSCGTVTPPGPTASATRTPSPTPRATVDATLCPGETVHETKRIFIPPAPGRADVLFAFDTTESMQPVLNAAKANALVIMNDLARVIPDIQFGVVDLRDYPISPLGQAGDWPYLVRQSVTANRAAVASAINATSAGGGGDRPEAYARALYESVTDSTLGWRADTRRFVIMFGDDVPHDDNLNARVVSPPVNPGGTWCGEASPCVRDPGRDGAVGTADDLDFQGVLDSLAAHRTTLLFVVSGSGSTSQANLTTYWRQWASWTNTGGDALSLADTAALPAAIQNLVTAASRRISRLELRTVPPDYQYWLTVQPPAYIDLVVPAGGTQVTFEVDITVPPGTRLGTTHTFDVKAIGDGAVYGEQGVTIRVPTWCATATSTPSPTRHASATPTPSPTGFPTATASATPTVFPCPPVRPPVAPSCPSPNFVRNPYFELGHRSWGAYSAAGRTLIRSDGALQGLYSAHFRGETGAANDEWLYQILDIPADATAASFSVEQMTRYVVAVNPPPTSAGNYLRASIYDANLTTELVRMWEIDPLLPLECPVDPSGFNLSPAALDAIRGRTVAVVLRFHKVTYGWLAGVVLDGVVFNVCAPPPPCRVAGDKTAAPGVVPPRGEVLVTLTLTGMDGACLPHRRPADVALVMDVSGSMSGQPLADAKVASKGFLDRMDPGSDQVALVSFSDSATVNQVLSANAGPVRAAIDGLTAGGGTNIEDGIARGQAELASPRHVASHQPVMVLLSDGRPTAGGDPRAAAAAAKAAGTRVFTIGLGNDVDPDLLRALASSPADYFQAPDSGQLATIYQQISGLIAGAPATNVVVVDRLSPHVTLVPGSFGGPVTPEVSPDGRTLTWRLPRLGLETVRLTYRVRMTEVPGTWPVNDTATATYTNSLGQPGSIVFPQPTVRVLPPLATHPDAMCRDHPGDTGRLPSNPRGEPWWDSPDIWVRHQPDGATAHENPLAGQINTVYVRVRNVGDAEVRNVTVSVYDTAGGANLRWPDDWVPEVGRATIDRLAAGATTVVAVPWMPPAAGHFCFLARISAPDDPIVSDGWVPFDNNLCQKNVQIVGAPSSPESSTTVTVGNRNRGKWYTSVSLNAADFPAAGTGRVTFKDPAVFERWMAAGGEAKGGRIDARTRSVEIVLGGGPFDAPGQATVPVALTLERIPFDGDELTELQVDVTGPAGARAPTIYVTAAQDGTVMGGTILRPPVRPVIYLPAVVKSSAVGGTLGVPHPARSGDARRTHAVVDAAH